MHGPRIDGERLWDSLMQMARIGATAGGGSRRLALSDEDRAGRDLFVGWCREAGLAVRIDQMGNVFARRAGTDPARAPVASGSHLDTQPHGGRFDGVYGVLAALEALRTLDAHGVDTAAPLEAVVWTNEEGVRFTPSMMASGVFAGAYALDFALACRDPEGRSVGEELERIGYAGSEPCGAHPLAAFFEAHIEQGPVLETAGRTIGVVTGVQGLRWYDVAVQGQDAHSGSTPMEGRRNALLGAAQMVSAIDAVAASRGHDARATVGRLEVSPNSRNTIPGRVDFTVDLRHPDTATLDEMDAALRALCERIAAERRLDVTVTENSRTPPVEFDAGCVEAVRRAARGLDLAHLDIVSGAGHDACWISRVAPTAMIFVPCAGGLSHNEAESAEPADLAAGCQVLLEAMLERAG